jgi:hypothetical protein
MGQVGSCHVRIYTGHHVEVEHSAIISSALYLLILVRTQQAGNHHPGSRFRSLILKLTAITEGHGHVAKTRVLDLRALPY